jgi:signal transduction histidine kinase
VTRSFDSDIEAIQRIDVIPKILEVITRTTGMRFAAVARVTPDRWIACAVRDEIEFGLTVGGELEVKTTICDEIRESGVMVAINHVSEDPLWSGHHTPAQYGLQSYISVPIKHHNQFFGTLCAIDPEPATPRAPEVIGMFELFADLIGRHLDAHHKLTVSEAELLDARAASELKDQFIAVLGHDLRNPLASIGGGMRLMAKTQLDEKARTVLELVQGSVARMSNLIDNVLDLTRGRLGGGFNIHRRPNPSLAIAFEVIDELRSAHPDRQIESEIVLRESVDCDTERLGQMLSNLVANALTHGASDKPVKVAAYIENGLLEVSVANQGPPIPPSLLDTLFQPFVRSTVANREGLGLGLYISFEIAKAHAGLLSATSDESETRFRFSMPLAGA